MFEFICSGRQGQSCLSACIVEIDEDLDHVEINVVCNSYDKEENVMNFKLKYVI